MKTSLETQTESIEQNLKELLRLRDEYRLERNVADSKYGKDFFMKISTEFGTLLGQNNLKLKNPELRMRMQEFIHFVFTEIRERESFEVTEDDVKRAGEDLNFVISALQ